MRRTSPRFSSRAAVCVTRLRDWTMKAASADIRCRPSGASESIEISSYSGKLTP